ncbi:hypothetical protein [Nocardioides litoris]|uniref:RipA family octameric membrane protein n=1 Tax=Nocardioides litoris TaxID=1926648 RepID=UPI00111E9A8A|nr:hypothetical protein [Nocardioides litoris]
MKLELYKLAVEEYRFQVLHNWSRTQYLLAFNVAVAGLGVLLSTRTSSGAIPVFALGALAAILTALVTRVQHDYYRAARDRVRRIEETIELPLGWKTDTTATMGGRKRRASVTQLVYLLLVAVAIVDLASIGIVLF